jgi:hypothetical protein
MRALREIEQNPAVTEKRPSTNGTPRSHAMSIRFGKANPERKRPLIDAPPAHGEPLAHESVKIDNAVALFESTIGVWVSCFTTTPTPVRTWSAGHAYCGVGGDASTHQLNHILKLSQGKHLKSCCFKLGLCKRLYIKVAKSDTVVIFEKLS